MYENHLLVKALENDFNLKKYLKMFIKLAFSKHNSENDLKEKDFKRNGNITTRGSNLE